MGLLPALGGVGLCGGGIAIRGGGGIGGRGVSSSSEPFEDPVLLCPRGLGGGGGLG